VATVRGVALWDILSLSGRASRPGCTTPNTLRHPAFAGYARRLLPRDDVAIDDALPIERIGSLLPYHSHVVPDVVLDALN
jgi:hypothetical protein